MRNIGKGSGKRRIIIAVGLLAVVIAATAVFMALRGRKKPIQASNRQSTLSLERMNLTKSISATGSLESRKSRSVSAAVQNVEVQKLLVQVGDSVKKGDELVRFDRSDLEEALSDAQENLSNVKSSSNQEITRAQKQYNTAVANRRSDQSQQQEKLSRAKESVEKAKKEVQSVRKQWKAAKDAQEKASCQEKLTRAEEALQQAKSERDNIKESQSSTNRQNASSIDNAQAALDTARSNAEKSVKEAQKQVDEAQETLEKCSLTAPMDGIVTAVNAEEGELYSGGTLVKIDDTSAFVVTATVDEYDISNVEKGQKVVILTEATGEEELEGEITFVAPSAGSTSQSSVSQEAGAGASSSSSDGYEIQLRVKTKDERLRMGMTAKCSIILEEAQDVFAVPYDAVHEDHNGNTYINAVGDSGNEKVSVQKGMESDYYVEISGDGLIEGLRVVIPTDDTAESTEQKDDSAMDSKHEQGGFEKGMPGGGMPDGGQGGPGRGMQGGRP